MMQARRPQIRRLARLSAGFFSTVLGTKPLAIPSLGVMVIPSLHNSQVKERYDTAALLGRRNSQRKERASLANNITISTASYAEKKWMTINDNLYLQILVQGKLLSVTKSFLTKELLLQAANMFRQFQDGIERNMLNPKSWVHNKTLYTTVTDKKPFINIVFVGFFVNNIWPMAP